MFGWTNFGSGPIFATVQIIVSYIYIVGVVHASVEKQLYSYRFISTLDSNSLIVKCHQEGESLFGYIHSNALMNQ